MKCRDLDGAVGEDGARLAHHFFDLVGRQLALLVEGRRFERESTVFKLISLSTFTP